MPASFAARLPACISPGSDCTITNPHPSPQTFLLPPHSTPSPSQKPRFRRLLLAQPASHHPSPTPSCPLPHSKPSFSSTLFPCISYLRNPDLTPRPPAPSPPHSQQALILLDNMDLFRARRARLYKQRSVLAGDLARLTRPSALFAFSTRSASGASVAALVAGGSGGSGNGGGVGGSGGLEGLRNAEAGGGGGGGSGGLEGLRTVEAGGGGGALLASAGVADGGPQGLWTAEELVELLADNAMDELQVLSAHMVMVSLHTRWSGAVLMIEKRSALPAGWQTS